MQGGRNSAGKDKTGDATPPQQIIGTFTRVPPIIRPNVARKDITMVILKAMTADGTMHTWRMPETDAQHYFDDTKPLPDRVHALTTEAPVRWVYVNPHQFLQWEFHI
jgi:hypothetical protein